MANTTISHNGELIAEVNGGQTATLKCAGMQMVGDVVVAVADVGGGENTCNCVIEVDTLPTENIDENAVYLCGGAYYKYAKGFTDLVWGSVIDGYGLIALSLNEMALDGGFAPDYYVIPTKTTEGVFESSIGDNPVFNLYYIEDEADVWMYLNDGGICSWLTFAEAMQFDFPYGGIIADKSEITSADNYYYAVMQSGWTKLIVAPNSTQFITTPGTYDVTDVATVVVDMPDAAIVGVWQLNATLENVEDFDYNVSFTSVDSDGTTHEFSSMQWRSSVQTLYWMWLNDVNAYSGTYVYQRGWNNENSRIVDFGTEPQMVSSAFKEWFVANARPIYTITQTE